MHLQRKNIQSYQRGTRVLASEGQMAPAVEPIQLTTLRMPWRVAPVNSCRSVRCFQ